MYQLDIIPLNGINTIKWHIKPRIHQCLHRIKGGLHKKSYNSYLNQVIENHKIDINFLRMPVFICVSIFCNVIENYSNSKCQIKKIYDY